MTPAGLAALIDHTLLRPGATAGDVARLCDQAVEHGFHSVCVNPSRVPLAAGLLRGTGVVVCSVAGFPLGATRAKAWEAARAVEDGASEIDMVADIGALLDGAAREAAEDVASVVEAAGGAPVKVIIEACLLDGATKRTACLAAVDGGASFVKTSTGFSTGGATEDDVRLMKSVVGAGIGVKASGGIATLDTALGMLRAGADRLGLSRSVEILAEMVSRAAGGVVQPPAPRTDPGYS